MRKAIALDLDGTLLTEEKKVSPRVRAALKKAQEMGIEILIATGRSYAALPGEVLELSEIHYVVTSNGAKVFRIPEKKVILENCILPERVRQLADLVKEYEIDAEVFYDGQGYLSEDYYERIVSGKTNRDISYIKETRKAVPDILTIFEEQEEKIENICFYFSSIEETEFLRKLVEKIPELTIASVFECNLEIGSEYSDKMKGIRCVLESIAAAPEELMAIGDGDNDVEMLKYAGLGIAMGNARELVRQAADAVTLTNEEDGVAVAIEQYILHKGD